MEYTWIRNSLIGIILLVIIVSHFRLFTLADKQSNTPTHKVIFDLIRPYVTERNTTYFLMLSTRKLIPLYDIIVFLLVYRVYK